MAVHKEWSRQEIQGTEHATGGASGSIKGGGGQGSGKKKKISICLTVWRYHRKAQHQPRRPVGTPENPRWEERQREKDLQESDGGERRSSGPEREDGTGLETLAILYARFEQVNDEVAKVDREFDSEFAQMQDEVEKVREAQRLLETSAQAVHDSR